MFLKKKSVKHLQPNIRPLLEKTLRQHFQNSQFPISKGEETFAPLVPGGALPPENFLKVSSPTRVSMKFAVSFIIVMILSKFQDDCVTQTDFSIFS